MIQGLLFLIIIVYAQTLIGIPFDLYRHFRIENRYGFNTMTVKLWITDLVKSLAVTTLMSGIVIVAALWMVRQSPEWWWLWVWGFFLIFGLFVMYISPYVIEPLFFKFEPLKSEGLEDRIKQLVQKTGLKVSRVFQVDASRRSRHSNAYFTGIGHVKRIVLFDTLIQQMSQEEILAVLAHEIGHWKKRHVLKKLILSEATALAGLYAAFLLAPWAGLPRLLGYEDLSFFGRIIVIGFLGSLALFPLTPLFNMLSRKDEREADWFAKDLTGNPSAMGSALIKLSRENLSNLHPHPLYAWFYYSHPPVIERLKNLEAPG
jgi:STE24 endopeptidase